MTRPIDPNSNRQKVFAFLDENYGNVAPAQAATTVSEKFDIPIKTARTYVSSWRSSKGIQRVRTKSRTVDMSSDSSGLASIFFNGEIPND